MSATYDAIVVGLGAMGASTAMQLARRGLAVLGLDAHAPPHTLGSHHGESRIIRTAYYEHPSYVPMLVRAFELWHDLARHTQHPLLRMTGGLMIGTPQSELISGVLASAREHGLAHELMSAATLRERYPAFHPDPAMVAVREADAGILHPEVCIATMFAQAREHGASLQCNEAVRAWAEIGDRIQVRTERGTYDAGTLVLCAGTAMAALHRDLEPSLQIERQVVAHFAPGSHAEWFGPERFPIFVFEQADGDFFYGFADLGSGVKVARHHGGAIVSADSIDRNVCADDIETVRAFMARHLPQANGALLASAACVYTNTPDFHFVIDRLPDTERVFIASVCSGHGFKFASVIGEIMADLVQDRPVQFDLSMFSAQRLVGQTPR